MSELTKFQRIKRKEGKERRGRKEGKENGALLHFLKNSKGMEAQYEKVQRQHCCAQDRVDPRVPVARHGHPVSSLLSLASEEQGRDSTISMTGYYFSRLSLQLGACGGSFWLLWSKMLLLLKGIFLRETFGEAWAHLEKVNDFKDRLGSTSTCLLN